MSFASPQAAALVAELDVDPASIDGTGRNSAITVADVRAAASAASAAPEDDLPSAPAHLSARASALWRQIVGDYMLAGHQLELLRRACEASDRADQAREQIEAEGLTELDRFGQRKPHPCVAIERDARLAIARLLRELALDVEDPDDARPPRIGEPAVGKAADA